MKKFLVFIFIVVISHLSFAQQEEIPALDYWSFIKMISEYHPDAMRARLQPKYAESKITEAKGGFDPQLSSNWDQKTFEGKNYFKKFRAEVNAPTIQGLSIVGGYERTIGDFLNPEEFTTGSGLWNLGIEANILRGFLFDERRAARQEAQIFQRQTENAQIRIFNNLYFEATDLYLEWLLYHQNELVLRQNLERSESYFQFVNESQRLGTYAMIDTLETFIIVLDAQDRLLKNEGKLALIRQKIDNYFWDTEGFQLNASQGYTPDSSSAYDALRINQFTDSVFVESHPQVLEESLKREQIQNDLRLAEEKLKPKLALKVNPLLATDNNIVPTYSVEDLKWGISFSSDLFRWQAKGKYEITALKEREAGIEIENTKNKIRNGLESIMDNINIQRQQIELQKSKVRNQLELLRAEEEKFSFGESSVFLLNRRREKLLDTQIKLNFQSIELLRSQLLFKYISGELWKIINEVEE